MTARFFIDRTPGTLALGIEVTTSVRVYGCREAMILFGPWCIGIRWAETVRPAPPRARIVTVPHHLDDGIHHRAYCPERPHLSAWGRTEAEAIAAVEALIDQKD